MTTKIYKQFKSYLLPRHIEWIRTQANKSGISASHLERILKDMVMDMDLEDIIKKYG